MIEKTSTKRILANNLIVIFILFLFLYGFFHSCLDLALDGTITHTTYIATIIYFLAISGFTLGATFLKYKEYSHIYYADLKARNASYCVILILILVLLLIYKSLYLKSQGLLLNPGVLKERSRLDLFEEINQSWVVSGYLVSGIFIYFIYYYNRIPKKLLVFCGCLLAYYIVIQLSIGNRRDFAPMIVGIFWVITNKIKIGLSLKWFTLMILGIFTLLLLSSLRSISGDVSLPILIYEALTSNEFVYPFYTLKFAVSDFYSGTLDFLYGKSLLVNTWTIYLPRIFFPWKPNTLAIDFIMKEFDGGMGYAYSPVTELFVNFGIIGPAIFFLFLGIFMKKIQGLKDQRINFLFFILIPDFCRGEISTIMYQFVFIGLFILIIPLMGGAFDRK